MASVIKEHGGRDRTRGVVVVNGQEFTVRDAEPQGDQILASAGCEPVDDFVLIQRMRPGSRVVSIDQTVEIAPGEKPVFYAFRGGDIHLFTVDTHGFQWGEADIAEDAIRDIAQIGPELVLEVEREDERPRLLAPGDRLPLTPKGVEHLRTRSRDVEVTIDGEARTIARGDHTTEELLRLLGVEPGYLLNLKRPGGLDTLKPGQHVTVKEGMEFFSQAPGGASS